MTQSLLHRETLDGIAIVTGLARALADPVPPPALDPEAVFAAVDHAFWQGLLDAG